MSDLDAAIRAKLAGFFNDACLGGCGCEESRCDVQGFDEMRDAALAVLDLHKPGPALEASDGPVCTAVDCQSRRRFFAVAYPCPTVRAIAEKLGVEVADADPA